MTLTRSISAKWLAHLVTMAVGFFLMPYVMKTMGEAGYGAWVFVNSVAGYSTLLYMGFGGTVCRFVADCRGREDWHGLNSVTSSVFSVYFAAASGVMLVSAGLAWAAPHLGEWGDVPISDVRIAMMLLGLNIAIGMLGSVYGGVLIATQRFDLYSAIEAINSVVRLVLTVALLQKEHALITLGLIFLGVTILENLITVWLAYQELPSLSIRYGNITRKAMKECFSFSMFTALRGMAVRVIHLTDVVVIGLILGKAAAVPYYIALRLVQMIAAPLEKIGDVVLPKAGDMHARGHHHLLEDLCGRAMGLTFMFSMAFLIGSAYFGDLFIQTWMGPSETLPDSYAVLIILASAQVVAQPMIMLRQTLMAVGDVKKPAWLDLSQAGINFVLSIVLAYAWGVRGVAWGTWIPLVIVELALLLPYGLRQLKFEPRRMLELAVLPHLPVLAAITIYCHAVKQAGPTVGWASMGLVGIGAIVVLGGGMMIQKIRLKKQTPVVTGIGAE